MQNKHKKILGPYTEAKKCDMVTVVIMVIGYLKYRSLWRRY